MSPFLLWLAAPGWEPVVKALLHSLWQAGVMAALLALVFRRCNNPSARYRFALGSLVTILCSALITWAILKQHDSNPEQTSGLPQPPVVRKLDHNSSRPAGNPFPIVTAIHQPVADPATVNWAGWLALSWLTGAALMLLRAAVQVAGAEQLRRNSRPLMDDRVIQMLQEAQRVVGLVRQVRLTVTDKLTSPAVVGVLLPTLILPLSLLTTLTYEQLRFVLLHELAHIRRGDYFANLFQLFLEALLFFNPAVWWISHQLRREREASCDALAIALSGAPVEYVRTLMHVAENTVALSAAAPAFGEKQGKQSALLERVQRLLVPGYRPALRLTWRAMLGSLALGGVLLAFSALGMKNTVGAILADAKPSVGSAEAATRNGQVSITNATARVRATISPAAPRRSPLIIYEPFQYESLPTLTEAAGTPLLDTAPKPAPPSSLLSPAWDRKLANQDSTNRNPVLAHTSAFTGRREIIDKLNAIQLDRVLFDNIPLGEVIRRLNAEAIRCDPNGQGVHLVLDTLELSAVANNSGVPDLKSLLIKINPAVPDVTLKEALNILVEVSPRPIRYSIEDFGVLFSNNEPMETFHQREFKVDPIAFARRLGVTPPDVQPGVPNRPAARTNSWPETANALLRLFDQDGVNWQPPKSMYYKDRAGILLVNAPASDLDAIEKMLAAPFDEGSPGVIAARTPSVGRSSSEAPPHTNLSPNLRPDLQTRLFGLDMNSLARNLRTNVSDVSNNILKDYFSHAGVELRAPEAIFLNDRTGQLYVRATPSDLDAIGLLIEVLNTDIPQVNIKVRFVELDVQTHSLDWYLRRAAASITNWPKSPFENFSGILTDPQFKSLTKLLEQAKGVEILHMPEVTTLSGRQAQLQAVDLRTIVNGLSSVVTNGVAVSQFQTETVPFGPTVDVVPTVEPDGFTISLTLTPTVTEFLGYDDPKEFTSKLPKRDRPNAELPLPRVRVRQTSTSAKVWDGQTLVLAGFTDTTVVKHKDGHEEKANYSSKPKRQLVVFVTPTIVDQGGNRLSHRH